MHVSGLTLIIILGVAIWWYKPLRVFVVQRTNRTVKVLLVVLPLVMLGRIGWGLYHGDRDEWLIAALLVVVLFGVWLGLVWFGNWLEKRRPTQARGPDLSVLTNLPGMPRVAQLAGAAMKASQRGADTNGTPRVPATAPARPTSSAIPAAPPSPSTPSTLATPSGASVSPLSTLADIRGIPGVTRPVNVTDVQRAAEFAQVAAPHVQRAAQAAAPHVQRAARAAAQATAEATADFNTKDVAGSLGRSSGRLYAKLRKSLKEGSQA